MWPQPAPSRPAPKQPVPSRPAPEQPAPRRPAPKQPVPSNQGQTVMRVPGRDALVPWLPPSPLTRTPPRNMAPRCAVSRPQAACAESSRPAPKQPMPSIPTPKHLPRLHLRSAYGQKHVQQRGRSVLMGHQGPEAYRPAYPGSGAPRCGRDGGRVLWPPPSPLTRTPLRHPQFLPRERQRDAFPAGGGHATTHRAC